MTEFDAAARPSCVIGASVRVSILDTSACPNGVLPTTSLQKQILQ